MINVRVLTMDDRQFDANVMLQREEILMEAHHLISTDRAEQYGSAADTHERIGKAWAAILDTEDIPSHTVALMMVALKSIRAAKNPGYQDSWVDIAGYAALGGEMADAE